jgi:hypothetical protein
MGTGIGEAMLIGAATGAGTSALTGGDPLKGALFGLAGGAIGPALGSALGGSAATAAGTATGTAATTGATSGLTGASVAPGAAGNASMLSSGFGNTIGTAANPLTTGNLGSFGQIGASGFGNAALPGVADVAGAGAQAFTPPVGGVAPAAVSPATASPSSSFTPKTGFMDVFKGSGQDDTREFGKRLGDFLVQNKGQSAMLGSGFANALFNQPEVDMPSSDYDGSLKRFRFNPRTYRPSFMASGGIADSGIAGTERGMYPQSQFDKTQYAVPSQMPTSAEVIASDYEPRVNPYTGEVKYGSGGIADLPVSKMYAGGGHLGGYSDGGRMLKGPGDGMSDSIPARIGSKQPARLADGEFVVPADVVSHLGNGSTDAGAKQLYNMMDKVRKARTGTKKQGREINPRKYVPA